MMIFMISFMTKLMIFVNLNSVFLVSVNFPGFNLLLNEESNAT